MLGIVLDHRTYYDNKQLSYQVAQKSKSFLLAHTRVHCRLAK